MDSIKVRLHWDIVTDGFPVHIFREGDGKRSYASVLTFEEVQHGLIGPAAPITLDDRAAQQLMDDLWNAGKRPTSGRQSEGALAAQGKHLEDMRALAFDKLKVEKPA